ncbi:hypothetical protein BJ875DRAFT_542251 [Amylocarpus encephaloides]|uniref:Uncharacterized protein n=1 Tax=Amylocarpus encephaloides TaxID=45428 RepID=A0A9P7YK21_9HELO|nr:hypothetical protein BJ875DRAFT_542251 [Amylocarpus encephaloides]
MVDRVVDGEEGDSGVHSRRDVFPGSFSKSQVLKSKVTTHASLATISVCLTSCHSHGRTLETDQERGVKSLYRCRTAADGKENRRVYGERSQLQSIDGRSEDEVAKLDMLWNGRLDGVFVRRVSADGGNMRLGYVGIKYRNQSFKFELLGAREVGNRVKDGYWEGLEEREARGDRTVVLSLPILILRSRNDRPTNTNEREKSRSNEIPNQELLATLPPRLSNRVPNHIKFHDRILTNMHRDMKRIPNQHTPLSELFELTPNRRVATTQKPNGQSRSNSKRVAKTMKSMIGSGHAKGFILAWWRGVVLLWTGLRASRQHTSFGKPLAFEDCPLGRAGMLVSEMNWCDDGDLQKAFVHACWAGEMVGGVGNSRTREDEEKG